MKKSNLIGMGVVASPLLVSSVAMAADGGGADASGLAKIGAALAIGLGAAGAATGQGKAAASALEGIARNPQSRADVFVPLILSLVFMEFQALLSFVIALTIGG